MSAPLRLAGGSTMQAVAAIGRTSAPLRFADGSTVRAVMPEARA
jgi:hypothetical protein